MPTDQYTRSAHVIFPAISESLARSFIAGGKADLDARVREALQIAAKQAERQNPVSDTGIALDLREVPSREWPDHLFEFLAFAIFEGGCRGIGISLELPASATPQEAEAISTPVAVVNSRR